MSDNERNLNTASTSPGPKFISLDEAAVMTTGTRVTFVPGMPAVFSESLKNICFVKGVPLIRVVHPHMGIDKATGKDRQARLYELTSQTGLPTMFHNQERPRNVWTEQLALAERIGAAGTPALVPDDMKLRAEVFGLCAVVLSEDGMIWNMRNLIDTPLGRKYGYSEEACAAAPAKIAAVSSLIDRRLETQEKRGSHYLVGDALTAADVYWATMSITILPPPPEIMPLTRQNERGLKYFARNSKIPVIAEALSKRIEDHQRYILTTYCETPAVLGGDPL